MKSIGILSDTHGVLRPDVAAALAGSDLILHAGDVGEDVIEWLEQIAPVVAVRGNTDGWSRLPETASLEIEGVKILVIHDAGRLPAGLDPAGYRVIVSGHTHRPLVEEQQGVLLINPGSAGPGCAHLPIAIARLVVDGGEARAELAFLPT